MRRVCRPDPRVTPFAPEVRQPAAPRSPGGRLDRFTGPVPASTGSGSRSAGCGSEHPPKTSRRRPRNPPPAYRASTRRWEASFGARGGPCLLAVEVVRRPEEGVPGNRGMGLGSSLRRGPGSIAPPPKPPLRTVLRKTRPDRNGPEVRRTGSSAHRDAIPGARAQLPGEVAEALRFAECGRSKAHEDDKSRRRVS